MPRTAPKTDATDELASSSKASSIFGTGKPRDINKPEIKELEERLEHTLAITKQQGAAAAAAEKERTTSVSSNGNNKNSSVNESPQKPNDRVRTDSTTSSTNSNRK